MTRFALPACTLAAMAMAGCTTYYDPPPAANVSSSAMPVPTAAASAHRSGSGVIESISLVSLPASAAAGGTTPPVVSGPYRVTMRMDDGTTQTMVVDNRAFLVGDRVQVQADGRLIRP